jgi:hypothetical protein
MANFLDAFPVVSYDIRQQRLRSTVLVCNLLYRIGMVKETLANVSAYYLYTIKDYDKPETLADKIYGDPTAHWMIILANDILNPLTDWPRDQRTFNKYIKSKYGSVPLSQTTPHHYEKVITRENVTSGVITETVYEIDYDAKATVTNPLLNDVPYETYLSLPESSYQTFTIGDDDVIETITRRSVTLYDHEERLNEAKRNIRIIKPEYYPSILQEFNNLVGNDPSYYRKLT